MKAHKLEIIVCDPNEAYERIEDVEIDLENGLSNCIVHIVKKETKDIYNIEIILTQNGTLYEMWNSEQYMLNFILKHNFLISGWVAIITYLSVIVLGFLTIGSKLSLKSRLLLLVVLPTMHLSWGVGFLKPLKRL